MNPPPKAERLTVVVVGHFNPAIVSPAWLAQEELISKDASLDAEVELIASDMASFSVARKQVQVLRGRLAVSTTDAREEETVGDLARGILEILSHTPTSMVGLNYEAHFLLPSEDSWHQKGHQLAPKEPWKALMSKPGLVNITMRDKCREDGHFDVSVGPSRQVLPTGLAVSTNDHYQLSSGSAHAAIDLISREWRASISRARQIALTLAEERGG